MDVFKRGEPVRGYQGGTFPVFRVDVTADAGVDLSDYTMRLVIEPRYMPGEAVYVANCTGYTNPDGSKGYSVQLTSPNTANLCGSYLMYFILSDGANTEYRNLVVPLEVLASPEEVSS